MILSIIFKGADKGSVVLIWDRKDCLKEVYRQLVEKEKYKQAPHNSCVLSNTLLIPLQNIRQRNDLSKNIHDYFWVKDPKNFGHPKFTNNCMICQEDQLLRIEVVILKTYHF